MVERGWVVKIEWHRFHGERVVPPLATPVWLAWYDPDAMHGEGVVRLTQDLSFAKVYSTKEQALADVERVSSVLPVYPDGRVNKPLLRKHVTRIAEVEVYGEAGAPHPLVRVLDPRDEGDDGEDLHGLPRA